MYRNGGWKTSKVLSPADLLTPEFWKALGKAKGWDKKLVIIRVPAQEVRRVGRFGVEIYHVRSHFRRRIYKNRNWVWQWHRFINHLIAGKSTEAFFKELLK